MQCKHCGAEVTGNFCPRCGEPAEEALRQCPVCGKAREDDEQFCTQCGYRFGKVREPISMQKVELQPVFQQKAEEPAKQPVFQKSTEEERLPAQKDVENTPCAQTVIRGSERTDPTQKSTYVYISRYMHAKRWLAFFFLAGILVALNLLFILQTSVIYIAASAIVALPVLIFTCAPIRKWNLHKIKKAGLIVMAILSAAIVIFVIVMTNIYRINWINTDNLKVVFYPFSAIYFSIIFTCSAVFSVQLAQKLNLIFYGTEKVTKGSSPLPQYDPFDFEKTKNEYITFCKNDPTSPQEQANTSPKAQTISSAAFDAGAAASSAAHSASSSSAAYSASGSSSSIGHIRLYDTVVHKKDWKRFRKHATQAELAVLAIGSRSRLTGPLFFIKSIVAVAGMILSIVFGLAYTLSEYMQFGIILLVGGYLFFNLLASKQIGYSDTYSSCYGKLSGEYSKMVKELFKEHIALTILRQIILIFLRIITIPYQFILMIIETFIPPAANWTVAHGGNAGAVVTLPKGYNIGNLAALGDYYKSCTFVAAWEQHMENTEAARLAKFSQYEYTDKYGVRQTAYSDDGKTFYTSTDKLQQVGTSQDNGKTIDLK